jgi:hypothetical protein
MSCISSFRPQIQEFWQHLVVEWLLDLQRFVPLFPSGQFLSEVQADIFIDSHGVLEGEQLVRASSTQYHLRYSEELVVSHDADSRFRLNHNSLRPIVTTPLANPSESPDEGFEDWKVLLSHPASNSINMHIYDLRWYPGPARSLVCFYPCVSPLRHTNFCVGATSTASDIRATRVPGTIQVSGHQYA